MTRRRLEQKILEGVGEPQTPYHQPISTWQTDIAVGMPIYQRGEGVAFCEGVLDISGDL